MQTRQVRCPVEGMHLTLSVKHQPQAPFTTDTIRCGYISSDRHNICTLLIVVPHEWNVLLEFSQPRYLVCEMRYVCRQIVSWGRHVAYVFYFARSGLTIHIPEEYDLAGLDGAFLGIE